MVAQHHQDLAELNKQAIQLIKRFLHGEAQAFQQLMQLYGPRVHRMIRKMIYSYHDAEDVNNEIWLKVAQNLHKFDQALPFHAWLFRLASNACIDYLRKKRDIAMEDEHIHYRLHQEQGTGNDSPESQYLQKELQQQVHALLEHLDETDRLILTLRFTEQLSYDEIGGIVGMSKNTVGTRLFRARRQLKELMAQHIPERRLADVPF